MSTANNHSAMVTRAMAYGKEQQRHRRGDRVLLYAVILFAACWLQIAVNVFAYFSSHQHHQTADAARFPYYLSSSSLGGGNDNGVGVGVGEDLLRPNSNSSLEQQHRQQAQQQAQQKQQHPSLEVQLSQLRTRLQHVKETLEKEVEEDENSDSYNYFHNEQIISSTNSNSNNSTKVRSRSRSRPATKPRKLFIPFTIRDAQRTVPTQIPHGFNVFDFIDLYATNGDQNQTAASIWTTNPPQKATLFHNGKPVPSAGDDDEKNGNNNNNGSLLVDCREYSKECYRAKMLRVIRYLLSLQQNKQSSRNNNNNNNNDDDEYYYFYMESDNDLCVPLSEVRELAYKYRRYFVSTGVGASGWIMSQQFLNDFYDYWNNINNNNNINNDNENNKNAALTDEEKLEPDTVASVMLKQKNSWSVTRRYLTSHSILVGNTEDADSISNLFERDIEGVGAIEDIVGAANTSSIGTSSVATDTNFGSLSKLEMLATNNTSTVKAKTESSTMASALTPARYLPRCLEPHRGVWPEKTEDGGPAATNNNIINKNNNNVVDMYHWDFFDYNLCPDSDIFPCEEGQLEDLVQKDPYYLRRNTVA